MKNAIRLSLSVSLVFSLLIACSTVPITGRSQFDFIPQSSLIQTSIQQYNAVLEKEPVARDSEDSQAVKRVGNRIARAVEKFLHQTGRGDEAEMFKWEFNVIKKDQINAWAMPGGKVAVYEGIIPVAGDDTGLAVVMSHEIAHVVANHGGERLSQQLTMQMGGMALSVAFANEPEKTRALWMGVYGVGAQVGVMLPFSRLHESEADKMGMVFMAMAGYDPRAAVDFWQRMSKAKEGGSPPEFLSTHPADETRIERIKEFLPEALDYYKK